MADDEDFTEVADLCDAYRPYIDMEPRWAAVEKVINWWGDHSAVLGPAADPDFLEVSEYIIS